VAALAAVARCDDRLVALAPGADHALDGLGREVGPVREHDHRGLCLQRGEAAAEGGSGAAFPVGAADHARVGLDLVCAEDHDDLVHRSTPQPFQDGGQQDALLGEAEACRGSSRQDDSADQVQPWSERQVSVTFAT